MKTILVSIIFLMITSMTNGQNKKQTFTKDQLAITVLNLRKDTIIEGKSQTLIGTGTFITHNESLFILTAAHVSKVMNESSYVVIKGENDKAIKIPLIDLIGSNIPNWENHPKADLSLLKLNPKKYVWEKKYLNERFLPSFYFSNKLEPISRDIQLTVLGFPLGLGADGYFSPLTYRTFPSSGLITLPRFDNKIPCEFFILENPSVGGYSGGPVFDLSIINQGIMTITTGNGTICYGIVHGTISDETGGKLAAITPSSFLFEILK